jgi:hypothetical protein
VTRLCPGRERESALWFKLIDPVCSTLNKRHGFEVDSSFPLSVSLEFVYKEVIEREIHRRLINECRCDERQKGKS